MVTTKHMNIKNRTHYFYNHLINIKDFDPKLLKVDKKSFKNSVYCIAYITKKDEYKINSAYPLCLPVHRTDGFIEEQVGSKYLNIAFTDSNNELLKNMKKFGVELKIVLKK